MTSLTRNSVSSEELRGFVERVENIEAQIKSHRDDIGVVMAEAKAGGFIPAAIRFAIKKRKMKPSDRQEAEALEDLYMHALGMATETPLFRAVGLMSIDVTAKDDVIEAMKKFVPADGSITIEAGGKPVKLTRDKEGNISVTEIVEKPVQQDIPGTNKKQQKARPEVPNVDADGAEALGREAFKGDVPIIQNPFPFGDARRARWDLGWRRESGSDGMGPDED